jgi:lipopolysaccharide biosynthesis regulator YciM
LLALLAMIAVAILTHLNVELLRSPFQLTPETTVPFYALLLGVFLTAFLPTTTLLLIQSIRRDLEIRRQRRAARQEESLNLSLHRGLDALTDGQWSKASEELAPVLAARPQDFTVLLAYGRAQHCLGHFQEALEVHQRAAVQYPQSVTVLHQLARDYEALGQPDVAEEIRNRIDREFPDLSLSVLLQRRDRAVEAQDWATASALHDRIRAKEAAVGEGSREGESISRGLRYQQGVSLLEDDRSQEAETIFEDLLRQEPRFIPARIMLGEAALEDGDEDRAIKIWRQGYQETGSPVFLQRLEDHFIEGADPPQAIETLWSMINQAENDLLPRFFLGRLYYRLEMHAEAQKVLDSIADRIACSPTYHFLQARIQQRMDHPARALKAFQSSLHQAGVPHNEYLCGVCRKKYPDWQAHCQRCGAWNSVELDFQEENIDAESLGVRPAPVWGVTAEAGAPAPESTESS